MYEAVWKYIAQAERNTWFKMQSIRLDKPGEHEGELVSLLRAIKVGNIEGSPIYAPYSIGRPERLVEDF